MADDPTVISWTNAVHGARIFDMITVVTFASKDGKFLATFVVPKEETLNELPFPQKKDEETLADRACRLLPVNGHVDVMAILEPIRLRNYEECEAIFEAFKAKGCLGYGLSDVKPLE